MYESSNYSFISLKYLPLLLGFFFIINALWIIVDPAFEIIENGEKRNAILSDSYIPLILGLFSLLFYFTLGQRVVRMRISNNEFEFRYKKEKIIKDWAVVEKIEKYWFVAPPLYSVKFENENITYFFTTSILCIVTPGYVFDISDMGAFIKKRRKDIPLLKELQNEKKH